MFVLSYFRLFQVIFRPLCKFNTVPLMVPGSLVANHCPKKIVKAEITYLRERVNRKCFWGKKQTFFQSVLSRMLSCRNHLEQWFSILVLGTCQSAHFVFLFYLTFKCICLLFHWLSHHLPEAVWHSKTQVLCGHLMSFQHAIPIAVWLKTVQSKTCDRL